MCSAFGVICAIALAYCLLEKSGGISVDYDGSMGFEVVDGLSNGYRIVAECGRGQSDEA